MYIKIGLRFEKNRSHVVMIFQKSKNQIGWQKALKILFTSYWVEQHVVVQRVKQFTFFTSDTLVLVRHAGQLVGWKDARWNKIILIYNNVCMCVLNLNKGRNYKNNKIVIFWYFLYMHLYLFICIRFWSLFYLLFLSFRIYCVLYMLCISSTDSLLKEMYLVL